MSESHQYQERSPTGQEVNRSREGELCNAACPVCGGKLQQIRSKFQCTRCHTICETCCDGGRTG